MILHMEQRSAEWLEVRLGKVTSSGVANMKAKRQDGKEAAPRKHYRMELVMETLTGLSKDHFVSKEMQWGIDNEPFARSAYEIKYNVNVDSIGFAMHDSIQQFGASPDGFAGNDGLLEIKCPNTDTHLEYILADAVPKEYEWQILAQLACTGREWCDFVSFDPRIIDPNLQLFVKRCYRDDALIRGLEGDVEFFLGEVDQLLCKFRQYRPAPYIVEETEYEGMIIQDDPVSDAEFRETLAEESTGNDTSANNYLFNEARCAQSESKLRSQLPERKTNDD